MTGAHGPAHPIAFLVLYLPFGAASGFGSITLAFLLHQHGVSVPAIAWMVAMNFLPNTWKVLWAPVIDTTLSARRWYAIGIGVTAMAFVVVSLAPLGPRSMPLFDGMAFILGLSSSIAAMGAERFMAYDTPEDQKGRAGGWSQAGNLGGGGLGGGLGLWLAVHTGHLWIAGFALAALSLACILMAIRLIDPPRAAREGSYLATLKETGRDVLGLATRRIGLLAIFICLLPMGTGAASNLWSSIAGDWRAGADEVALVSGVLNGVVAIFGALIGGYVCDRIDRKAGYALFGLVSAAAAVAMALGPRTPIAFLGFATAYNFVVGACYGAYAGLTLEAIGQGAAATKFNLIASVANVPIMLMTLIDGQAQKFWGSGGMLLTEAACAAVAVALYAGGVFATRGWSWRGAGRLIGLAPTGGG
ncbi:MAG TPA: MFS transporter [Caulobacteraceae bacterium]